MIAAPGIGDHQQPQPPVRHAEDAPDIARPGRSAPPCPARDPVRGSACAGDARNGTRCRTAGSAATGTPPANPRSHSPAATRTRSDASPHVPARTAPPAPARTRPSPAAASTARRSRPASRCRPAARHECPAAQRARSVDAAGQRAQFRRAEYAIGHCGQNHKQFRTISQAAATRAAACARNTATCQQRAPGMAAPAPPAARSIASNAPPSSAGTRSPCSGARISTSSPMKRARRLRNAELPRIAVQAERRHVRPKRVGDLPGIAPVGHADDARRGSNRAQLVAQRRPVDRLDIRIVARERAISVQPVEPHLRRDDSNARARRTPRCPTASGGPPAIQSPRDRIAEQRKQHQVARRCPMEQHALARPGGNQGKHHDRRRGEAAQQPGAPCARAAPHAGDEHRHHRQPDPRQHEQRLAGQRDERGERPEPTAGRARALEGERGPAVLGVP